MFQDTRSVHTPATESAWNKRLVEIGPRTITLAAILGIVFYSVSSVFALFMLGRLAPTPVLIRMAPVLTSIVSMVALLRWPQWYVPLGYLTWVPLSMSACLGMAQVTLDASTSVLQIVPMILLPSMVILWRPVHTAANALFCLLFAVVAVTVLAPEHQAGFFSHWFVVLPVTVAGIAFAAVRYHLSRTEFMMTFELERRVALRTAELADANRELERFSYMLSHTLVSPLRAIEGFSEMLVEGYSDKLDEEALGWLGSLRAGAVRMGGLLDDLLTLVHVSQEDLSPKPIDMTKMVNEIIEDLRKIAPSRDIEFLVGEGITASGDARLLKFALESVLHNSMKFTATRDHAVIEFGVVEIDGESLYFVRDNGVGFDEAFSSKLFLPFESLHSPDEFGGNGVGLAVVQRIVNRHGGRVWGEGEVERGATFYMTLGNDDDPPVV